MLYGTAIRTVQNNWILHPSFSAPNASPRPEIKVPDLNLLDVKDHLVLPSLLDVMTKMLSKKVCTVDTNRKGRK